MGRQRQERTNRMLGWLCQGILLAGLVSGILFFGAEELDLPFSSGILWGVIAGFSLLSAGLCCLPVAAGWLALGGAAASGLALYGFWEPVSLGARQAAANWIDYFNWYFKQWKAGPEMPELEGLSQARQAALLEESCQIFLIVLAGILLFWCGFFLFRLSSLALAHVLMGLELVCFFSVGVVPEGYGALWYLAAVFLWWSAGGSRGLRSTAGIHRWIFCRASWGAFLGSAAVLALALAVCSTSLFPRTQGILEGGAGGIKTWIRARLEEAADWDALLGGSVHAGGVSGGNLENQGDRANTGTVALTVTVEEQPTEPLYLKAYVGSQYTGTSWETLPSSLLEEETGLSPEEVWQLPVDSLGQSRAKECQVTVNLYDAASQYLYVPYGAELPEDVRLVSDQYLRRWDSQEDTFPCYAMPDLGQLLPADAGQAEEIYREYVRRHYLQVPDSFSWESWEDRRPQSGDLAEMAEQVQSYLDWYGDYTLTPGSVPEGRGFVEHFLFYSGRGYCTHFASAATVMFRLWGVPARYVEGYVAFPENFQDNGDGTWTAWITDQNAHAWTEVYRDGLTWCPVEATPPYLSDTAPAEEQEPSREEPSWEALPQEEPETEPEEETRLPEETAEETEPESEQREPEGESAPPESQAMEGDPEQTFRWMPLLLAFLPLAALAAPVWGYRRLQEKRRRRMEDPDRRKALLALGEEVQRVLSKGGKPLSILEPGFGEAAGPQAQGVTQQELEQLARLVQRTRFSLHPVTEEEYQRCLRIYRKIREKK